MDIKVCSSETNEKIDNTSLESDDVLNELQRNQNESDIKIYQKLLGCPGKNLSGNWQPVLLELLKSIAKNTEPRNQRSLLASQAFFIISVSSYTSSELTTLTSYLLNADRPILTTFDEEIEVLDLELFKLTIIHGHLFGNSKHQVSTEILTLSFDIIHKNCIKYTKYTYFGFKLLDIWLKKTKKSDFWRENDSALEEKLQAVIFSNWNNCINEIEKINASDVFPIYLNIMRDKYPGFLEHVYSVALDNLSWQRTTKYVILSEISKLWHGLPPLNNLEKNQIIQSITKHHLKHAAARLYLALLSKMDGNKWNKIMKDDLCLHAKVWEDEENIDALEIFWELWMKPTVKQLKMAIIPSLWLHFCMHNMIVCQSYLARYSNELGVSWMDLNTKLIKLHLFNNPAEKKKVLKYWLRDYHTHVPPIINDARDCVRLNVFAMYCRKNDFLEENSGYQDFLLCKHFLFFNANAASVKFRKGIIDNVKMLLENNLSNLTSETGISVGTFFHWMSYFILDCFEPGSCYQRRVIGLKLCEVLLSYTEGHSTPGWKKKKYLVNVLSVRRYMIRNRKYLLRTRYFLSELLRLCLDHIDEIKCMSFYIIKKYFPTMDALTIEGVKIVMTKANRMIKSPKYYELSGGVKLLTLIAELNLGEFTDKIVHEILFERAKNSFTLIKKDFLKALAEGSDLNGTLSALLQVNFQEAVSSGKMTEEFIRNLLNLLDDGTLFYISLLSTKSSDTNYSSSFAEMSIAIEKTIKNSEITDDNHDNIISPAHQIVISCIWLSLKTFCDLAAKISTLAIEFNEIKRCVDLIVSVLMKCRHKGAIEAAGVALGVSMRHLTEKSEYDSLFDTYLDKLLKLGSEDKINLTRRGAGLSIMFHAMIVNDNKRNRRLLHSALRQLMNYLSENTLKSETETNNDSPGARQLHFLRTIVADKTLHIHLVPFIEEISMICFAYLQSTEWAIRNASLQLLGAVIPRVVGQATEGELDFGGGYLVDHFVTYYPKLADYVLKRISDPAVFHIDGHIVPVLTLLSKMSIGGCDLTDYSSREYTLRMKNALRPLLGHPVDHVRYLAAKVCATLIPMREIPRKLLIMKGQSLAGKDKNYIHGHLLVQICLQLLAKSEGIWLQHYPHYSVMKEDIENLVKLDIGRAKAMLEYWLKDDKERDGSLCNVIEATFLRNLNMLPLTLAKDDININPTELITVMERASEMKNPGISEFIDQLLKFNSWSVHIDNIDDVFLAKCFESNYNDIRYYSLKHLHPKLKLPFREENGKEKFVLGRFKLFSQLLEAAKNMHDEFLIIEIVELMIRVMKYDQRNRCEYLRYEKFTMTKAIMKYAHELVENYQCNKIQQLAHMLITLCSRHLKGTTYYYDNSLEYESTVEAILRAVIDGDEYERIWAIDCLTNLRVVEYHQYEKYIFTALFLLSSDESCEVRKELTQKLRDYEWYPKWRKKCIYKRSTARQSTLKQLLCELPKFFIPPEVLAQYVEDQLYPIIDMLDIDISGEDNTNTMSCSIDFQWQKSDLPLSMPVILQYNLHEIVHIAIGAHRRNYSQWVKFLCAPMDGRFLFIPSNRQNSFGLTSPFDQDEIYREYVKVMSLFLHFLHNRISPYTVDSLNILQMNVSKQRKYITGKLQRHNHRDEVKELGIILDMKISEYLLWKYSEIE